MQSSEVAGPVETREEKTIVMRMLGRDGDKKHALKLKEAIRIVEAAMKNGKAYMKIEKGKARIISSAKEIDEKTEEVAQVEPTRGG
jgi:hypothetical protein